MDTLNPKPETLNPTRKSFHDDFAGELGRYLVNYARCCRVRFPKPTWTPPIPIKTTVLLNGAYMRFHVSLGEGRILRLEAFRIEV